MPNWHPDVTDSIIENGSGREVGAIRAIHLRDGTPLRERLNAISDEDYEYSYSVIESPLPIANHRSTVRFSDSGNGCVRVVWATEFEATDGADPEELKAGVVAGVVEPGIDGFEAAAHTNS